MQSRVLEGKGINMPHTTFPHQRVIKVHRERASANFLGIKNENWQAASRILGAHALRLYLYIAANADNFDLALSPAAIEAAIGMPRSTYHDQFRKLINYGYIVERQGNLYDFYETPQEKEKTTTTNVGLNFEDNTTVDKNNSTVVFRSTQEDIEINNININTNINKSQEKQVSPAHQKYNFNF